MGSVVTALACHLPREPRVVGSVPWGSSFLGGSS